MMLATAIAVAALQAAPQQTPAQTLSSVALCVAALEYRQGQGASAEALEAWRRALAHAPGSTAESRDAALAAQRRQLTETAARADDEPSEAARAVLILAPNCASAEAGARVADRFAQAHATHGEGQ